MVNKFDKCAPLRSGYASHISNLTSWVTLFEYFHAQSCFNAPANRFENTFTGWFFRLKRNKNKVYFFISYFFGKIFLLVSKYLSLWPSSSLELATIIGYCVPQTYFGFFYFWRRGGDILATKNLRLLPYYCLVFTPVEMKWEQGLPILFYFISLGI